MVFMRYIVERRDCFRFSPLLGNRRNIDTLFNIFLAVFSETATLPSAIAATFP